MTQSTSRFSPNEPVRFKRLWSWKNDFSYASKILAIVWRSSPIGLIAVTIFTILAAALPSLMAWVGKQIVDAVVAVSRLPDRGASGYSSDKITYWVIIELAIVVGVGVVERMLVLFQQLLGFRLTMVLSLLILEKALQMDMQDFEDSKFYDSLTRAYGGVLSRPAALIQQNFQILRGLLTIIGIGLTASFLKFNIWMAIGLLAAVLPAFFSEARFSGKVFLIRNRRSPDVRRLEYLQYLVTNDQHVKEVKLFGLGSFLLSRYRDLAQNFYKNDCRLAISRATWSAALTLLAAGAFYGIYLFIAIATAEGRISIGSMIFYVSVFRQGQSSFQSLLSAVAGTYETNLYMSSVFEYLEIPAKKMAPPSLAATKNEVGIRFEKVGFQYADTKEWALRDISVFIPSGKSFALVGANGAGKTTFIKLLTRLYEPTEGRIFLNGRDLRDWDEMILRQKMSVIFQDFNRYQLTAKENIGFGDIKCLDNMIYIRQASIQGDARQIIENLPQGFDTQLGNWFENGLELSGGQWHKIALSRAFMKKDAEIFILDEPTAALDAVAECALFERLKAFAIGRTTIIISHRFPLVRNADWIIVLEHGKIVEQGKHEELVISSGKYAEFFSLQAAGYS